MASPVKQFEISEIIRFGMIGDSPVAPDQFRSPHESSYVAFTTGGPDAGDTGHAAGAQVCWQSLAEDDLRIRGEHAREVTGKEGMRFPFPLVLLAVLFVLVAKSRGDEYRVPLR